MSESLPALPYRLSWVGSSMDELKQLRDKALSHGLGKQLKEDLLHIKSVLENVPLEWGKRLPSRGTWSTVADFTIDWP